MLGFVTKIAQATSDSVWIQSSDPTLRLDEDNISEFTQVSRSGVPCDNETSITSLVTPNNDPVTYNNYCVVGTGYGELAGGWLIKPMFDQYYAPLLDQTNKTQVQLMQYPGPNGFIYRDMSGFHYYKNTSGLFKKISEPISSFPYYYVMQRTPDTTFHWKDGFNFGAKEGEYSFSDNGEWMVIHSGGQIVKFNIATQQATIIDSVQWDTSEPPLGLGHTPPPVAVGVTISNDGRYVAAYTNQATDLTNHFLMYDTATCVDDYPNDDRNLLRGCSKKSLYNILQANVDNLQNIEYMHFSPASSQLIVYVRNSGQNTAKLRRYIMTAAGYTDSKLDYLALGDSFSSGEGDTQNNPDTGKRYYLPGTDVEKDLNRDIALEKCHLSSRSYGFVLERSLNLSAGRFGSVACSGSVYDDITNISTDTADAGGYRGRFDQFKDANKYPTDLLMQARQNAIDNMIPGRAAQIQFITAYRPAVVTIGIGGNNAGFPEKMQQCVGPFANCPYKQPGEARAGVGKGIQSQFSDLAKTYKKLADASPNTKVLVIGYPVFTDASSFFCQPNVQLGTDERQFINESTKYMNQVIQAAAKSAGAGYIDVQDALKDHELCGSKDSYVTGLAIGNDLNPVFGYNTVSKESYHPNNLGHTALARKILDAISPNSLTTHNYCPNSKTICPDNSIKVPELSPYFRVTESTKPTPKQEEHLLDVDSIQKDTSKPMMIHVHQEYLQPSSPANFEVHSDPISLGSGTVDANGVLDMEVTIPDSIKPGQHEIHLLTTSGGETPLDLYAPLFVAGAPGDVDEDGIPDSQDKCAYVQQANVDADEDGIDDGCDGNIIKEEIPYTNLYRARNGDSHKLDAAVKSSAFLFVKTYENPNRIYIERDIKLAQKLKLYTTTQDYDPDGDGWALVARSSDTEPSEDGIGGTNGTFAAIKTDKIANKEGFDKYIPTISARTAKAGCLSMTPLLLTIVSENDNWSQRQPRILATDTNTCRTQPPEADTDNNGVADNVQQLYRARNGNQATSWFDQLLGWLFGQNENPKTVYIERNTVAAEAQLGKSDYDKDVNGWALVGSGDTIFQQGTVKRLQVINQQPVAAILSQFNTCSVLTPVTLATVKRDEQRKLKHYIGIPTITCSP